MYTFQVSCPMPLPLLVRKKIRKRRLFKKVQAFCEEKVLRCLLGVFWYAKSKNQCWQAEKWRLHYLICIFPRWPPNLRNIHKNLYTEMPNWYKSIQKHLLMIGDLHCHQFMYLELKYDQEVIRGDNLSKKSCFGHSYGFFMIVHAYYLSQMCQE